jgi:hypothetical protein
MARSRARAADAMAVGLPPEVQAVNREIANGFDQAYPSDAGGRRVGDARFGVYAFFDYDDEPIYVGQTRERLRGRIGRHLTNQRTDAVAMAVLDPFEVLTIRMWPLFDLEDALDAGTIGMDQVKEHLNRVEYTVYQDLITASRFKAILNEKDVAGTASSRVSLPPPFDWRIVPPPVYEGRKHVDLRIARRAATIARLAQVISERNVSKGLRRTLLTQANRLADLAHRRFDGVAGPIPVEGNDDDS